MAKNEVFNSSKHLTLKVGTGILSGDPVRVGSINGVAQTDSGDLVGTTGRSTIVTSNKSGFASVQTDGVHNLTVTLSGAMGAGTPIYSTVVGANKKATLSDTASGGKLFGALWNDEASGTAVVPVIVYPFSV